MKAEGGCRCGAVRFVVEGPSVSSVICHCRSCQKSSGAASVGWVMFDRSKFHVVSGTLKAFVSSPGVERCFCPACGTQLTYSTDDSPGTIDITTVSLDDPSCYPPTREIWLEHKLSWEATNAALGQYPRNSGDGPYK